MTEFVRFNAAFEHKDVDTGERVRFPVGWAGEVDGAVAAAARKVGAVPEAKPEDRAAAKPAGKVK